MLMDCKIAKNVYWIDPEPDISEIYPYRMIVDRQRPKTRFI